MLSVSHVVHQRWLASHSPWLAPPNWVTPNPMKSPCARASPAALPMLAAASAASAPRQRQVTLLTIVFGISSSWVAERLASGGTWHPSDICDDERVADGRPEVLRIPPQRQWKLSRACDSSPQIG